MKLNSEKNLLIYQKSLYVEQLHYYSKLCKLYSNLANLHSSLKTAEEIAEYYSKPLSLSVQGKFDYIIKEDYSEKELEIFKKYEYFSQCFYAFKKASDMLNKGTEMVRNSLLSSPILEVRKFQQDIDSSSINFVAYKFSIKARKSCKVILCVDHNAGSHNVIVKVNSGFVGANISEEATKRKNKQLGNHRYTAKSKFNRKKLLSFSAVLALTLTGVSHNAKNGYEMLVSKNTQKTLGAIGYTISFFKNHPEIVPSQENMLEIRNALDLIYDDIMSDLVTKAFEETNLGSTVTSVETMYDKTICIISYTDKKGEHKKTIMKFDAEIGKSFTHEYSLDTEGFTLEDLEKIYNHANHLAGAEFSYSTSVLEDAN